MNKQDFMRRAIALSETSVINGGGPFGAVITRGNEIISEESNSVTRDNDPTAHAEINAIRKAALKLGSFDLSGCDIYCSCEPCPMCFGAIYWAHLDKIYYACSRTDAANAGFDDELIYREISLCPKERKKQMERLLPSEAKHAFEMWAADDVKTKY